MTLSFIGKISWGWVMRANGKIYHAEKFNFLLAKRLFDKLLLKTDGGGVNCCFHFQLSLFTWCLRFFL